MGGFVSGIGGALGFKKSGAQKGAEQAQSLWGGLNAPDLTKLRLKSMGPSAMNRVTSDARAVGAQNTALDTLKGFATQNGLSSSDMAGMQQATNAANINEQGNQEAILQNARARGLSGSGNSLAAMLGSQQGSTNRLSNMGTGLMAGADERRMSAANSLGSLGTSVEGQRFGEKSQKASANDMINQYNNSLANQSIMYNTTQLPQQNFENKKSIVTGQANAALGKGAADTEREKNALSGGIMTGGLLFSDRDLKKDIKKADVKELLDTVSASEYEYKDKKHGEGKFAGPMAQELEKTEVGRSAVMDTPEGKMVHGGRVAMLALASAKDLHERIKKLEKKND